MPRFRVGVGLVTSWKMNISMHSNNGNKFILNFLPFFYSETLVILILYDGLSFYTLWLEKIFVKQAYLLR